MAMPWLLYRYLLGELLRTIVLTTAILVTVIAFGAAIKPLAAGGLGPGDIVRYVGFAIVPMLQFAIPFAAGFGGTLVLHRFTTDNEIVTAAVSGVSYRKILLPILALGIVLTLGMLYLLHFVIPFFWVRMEKAITKDLTRLLQTAVDNGEAFVLGDLQIYAEDMEVDRNPSDPNIRTRLFLWKVAAADLDRDGAIITDVTATSAVIDIYDVGHQSFLMLALTNTVAYDPNKGMLAISPRLETRQPILLPSRFDDHPKFMSLKRMLQIRANPDLYVRVIRSRNDLAAAVQTDEIWRALAERIEQDHRVEVTGPREGERYVIEADRFRVRTATRAGPEPVIVRELRNGGLQRTIHCERLEFRLSATRAFGVRFDLILSGCRVFLPGREDEAGLVKAELTLTEISIPDLQNDEFFDMSSSSLIALARARSPGRDVQRRIESLESQRIDVRAATAARLEQRNALAVTASLLLLLGCVLAMAMRNSSPLAIYLVAFLPGVVNLLIISGGGPIIRDHHLIFGRMVVWSGDAMLVVFMLLAYFRLSRN